MWFLVIFTCLIALFQMWWSVAYVYAYSQIREAALLLQVVQGVMFGMLFVTITISLLTGQDTVNIISGTLLIVGLAMGFLWRRRGGVDLLFDYYPRAMLDVLLFRKPKVDLKRRVRGR
jgi:hypothetical protein